MHYEQPSYVTGGIQATVVSILTQDFNFKVASVYCRPRFNLKKADYVTFLQTLGARFLAGGDFNAKNISFGSRLTNTKGRELSDAVAEIRAEVQSSGKPTYWPTDPDKVPDLIDFFIVKNLNDRNILVEEADDLFSDHTAVKLTLSTSVLLKPPQPFLCNKWTDWEGFQSDLADLINLSIPLKTQDQLDSEVEQFTKDIQKAAWNNTPTVSKKTSGHYYPHEVLNLIHEKRKARKKWQQTRSPADKTVLNGLCEQVKMEIRKYKNETMSNYLQNLSSNKDSEYSLWTCTKNLKRPKSHVPPIRKDDLGWARSNQEKADLFAEHLTSVFTPHEMEDVDPEEIRIPEQYPLDEPIKHTTPKEVKAEINKINVKKCPGFDLVTGQIMKHLPQKGIIKLTNLINAAFRLKYVPALWKVAEIIMIPKPGKAACEVSSYRPISLLPITAKIFEKILLKRLQPEIEKRQVIPNHQFGFREKHGTIDQVHRITQVIENALEEKQICSTLFLDVAQAFDKVWHEGLIRKLSSFLPRSFVEILQSYISERVFRVKHEESYSKVMPIKAGVPQGSVLGPVLYVLYTSDLPINMSTTTATFADDTAILACGHSIEESIPKLQEAATGVFQWARKWKIKLQETKSVVVNFTNKDIVNRPITINNKEVPHANTAKYLGMTMDTKLRWKHHAKKKREELDIKYRKMYWLLGRKSELSTYNKLLIYKQVLKPVWTYGLQLYGCTKDCNLKPIQTFQNKVLRNIVNAPWYCRNSDIHRDLGIPTVAEEVKACAAKHETRLHDHVNVEALQLLDSSRIVRRLKRTKPQDLV